MEAKPANTNNDKAELVHMDDKKDEISTKTDSGVVHSRISLNVLKKKSPPPCRFFRIHFF